MIPLVFRTDTAADLGVASALISIVIVIALTFVGLAARKSCVFEAQPRGPPDVPTDTVLTLSSVRRGRQRMGRRETP